MLKIENKLIQISIKLKNIIYEYNYTSTGSLISSILYYLLSFFAKFQHFSVAKA